MILDKEVQIIIGSHSFKRYKELGYDVVNCGQKLIIKIEHLSKGSNFKINVKCDICDKIKILSYDKYIMNTKNLTESYCCCNKCAKIKSNKTCIDKYGTKYPMQNMNIFNKQKQTCLKEYAVDRPTQNENILAKMKNTNLKKYGFTNPLISEKINYKSRQTCLKKYGVEYAAQNKELYDKQMLSGLKLKMHEKTGLKYQGKNELNFLDYCYKNDIKVEKIQSIKYKFENKNRVYYPDFYFKDKNLIVEIKSKYYYNLHINKNIAKQAACLKQGYNFVFVIDKQYDDFNCLIFN